MGKGKAGKADLTGILLKTGRGDQMEDEGPDQISRVRDFC